MYLCFNSVILCSHHFCFIGFRFLFASSLFFCSFPRRMFAALDALFACPQNNLRVFQAGNLIYGDHANSISCDELHTRLFPG